MPSAPRTVVPWPRCRALSRVSENPPPAAGALGGDADVQAALPGPAVLVCWSGLVWLPCVGFVRAALRRAVIGDFLRAADGWLQSAASWRWEVPANTPDPGVDHSGVVSPVVLMGTILHPGRSPPPLAGFRAARFPTPSPAADGPVARHVLAVPAARVVGPSSPLSSPLRAAPARDRGDPDTVGYLALGCLPPVVGTVGSWSVALLASAPPVRAPGR